jgi:hypothetical protein
LLIHTFSHQPDWTDVISRILIPWAECWPSCDVTSTDFVQFVAFNSNGNSSNAHLTMLKHVNMSLFIQRPIDTTSIACIVKSHSCVKTCWLWIALWFTWAFPRLVLLSLLLFLLFTT